MKNITSIQKLFKPTLRIKGNNNKTQKYIIQNEKIIIGRLKEFNDISLVPDPQKLVTRSMHCSIEFRNGAYWIIDNASKNGTFLKRRNITKRIQGQDRLYNNDLILILSKINKNGEPDYWEIKFNDPQETEDAEFMNEEQSIEYDWVEAKLFLISNKNRTEVKGLTPQEHKLLRYMDERNKNNGNASVMCTYEELISTIWEEFGDTRSKNDVNHLIAILRKKIEKDIQDPKFLQNIRGMGYRLITKQTLN